MLSTFLCRHSSVHSGSITLTHWPSQDTISSKQMETTVWSSWQACYWPCASSSHPPQSRCERGTLHTATASPWGSWWCSPIRSTSGLTHTPTSPDQSHGYKDCTLSCHGSTTASTMWPLMRPTSVLPPAGWTTHWRWSTSGPYWSTLSRDWPALSQGQMISSGQTRDRCLMQPTHFHYVFSSCKCINSTMYSAHANVLIPLCILLMQMY